MPASDDLTYFTTLTRCIADAMLSDRFEAEALTAQCRLLFDKTPGWLPSLIRRVLDAFGPDVRPLRRNLLEFLQSDFELVKECNEAQVALRSSHSEQRFVPATDRIAQWKLPAIRSTGQLADWLRLDQGLLSWLADRKHIGRHCVAGKLCHYRYEWQRKTGGRVRLIEAPKSLLKSVQRQILSEILTGIPVHDAAHGFLPNRSIRSFVEPHLGQAVVLTMDLCDFFPSIQPFRLVRLLMLAGYPEEVARTLTSLCTNSAPYSLWQSFPEVSNSEHRLRCRQIYQTPHFPQGSPTSPAISNLCSYRLDCRLAGLAASAGAAYTRYADDLLFSGDRNFARGLRSFQSQVAAIATLEGLQVNYRKTRAMHQSQRQTAAGVVLNQRPNLCRRDFDRLKAILHQCVVHGPASQNREGHADFRSHLRGRVNWVQQLNPGRGQKLLRLFEKIDWSR